jgi:Arc/MetJ family transcription regulator
MTRIMVDVNDEWLEAARRYLGTDTKVATINAALRAFAQRKLAAEVSADLDGLDIDYSGSADAWRLGGGRDLSRFVEDAHEADAA